MNAEKILEMLAEVRKSIPQVPQQRTETGIARHGQSGGIEPIADFECAAVADALESIADSLGAAIDDAQSNLLAQCLEVYYTTEELSRDPAHADLIPKVEEMRRAYEQSYGKPIPPRG
jgi:hypothetical protein